MIVLLLLTPICIGFLISLLVIIPPIHFLAQNSATLRLMLSFTLGLASFIILHITHTYPTAYVAYHMGELRYECQSCDRRIYVAPEFTQEEQEHEQAIIIEYWSKELLPPVFQSTCNTKHPTVCRLAEEIRSRKNSQKYSTTINYEKIKWNTFLFYFESSFFGTISTVFFVHLFTRRKDIHSRIPLF